MLDLTTLTPSAPPARATADVSRRAGDGGNDTGGNAFGDALASARSRDGGGATDARTNAGTPPALPGTRGHAATDTEGDDATAADGPPAEAQAVAGAMLAVLPLPAADAANGQRDAALAGGRANDAGALPVPLPAAPTVPAGASDNGAAPAATLAAIDTQRNVLSAVAPVAAEAIAGPAATGATGTDTGNAAPVPATFATALAAAGTTAADGARREAGDTGHRSPAGPVRVSRLADSTNPAPPAFQPAPQTARIATEPAQAADIADAPAADAAALAGSAPAQRHADAAPPATVQLAPPVSDPQWPQALGQQLVRLGTPGHHTAELDLNPPHLGPLKVVLNVVNDQAQAQFVSPHQAVRAAVEAALPQLRTSLAESGIQLGQATVGGDGFAGQPGGHEAPHRQASAQGEFRLPGNGPASGNRAEDVPRVARVAGRGEIDTFA